MSEECKNQEAAATEEKGEEKEEAVLFITQKHDKRKCEQDGLLETLDRVIFHSPRYQAQSHTKRNA